MILCRCECDQVFNVEPDLAGTEAECPSCHRVFTVPAKSDPDVVMIAAKDATDSPFPALRQRVIEGLADGTRSPDDRILEDGQWRLLREAFAAETAADAPAESGALQEDGQPESSVPPAVEGGASRLRLRKGGGVGTDSESTDETEGPTDINARFRPPPLVPKKRRSLVKGIIRAGVAIVVLALGYKFGFGPVVMNLLDRPSLVVVKNGEAVSYEAILGWRRVSRELPAGAIVPFRVFVGMTENQTLTLRPMTTGAGEVQKIEVKVSPGHSILVNPGQRTVFWLIDENGAKDKRVDNEVRKLVQQLGANDRPTEAETTVNAVRGLVREAIKGQNTDLVIGLDAYRMDELAGLTPAGAATEGKLLLTAMPMRRIAFANGAVNVTLAKTENLEGQLELPAVAVSLLPDVTVNVPARQSLQILRTARTLRVSMHIPNQVLKVRKGQFPGTWDYTANYKADAAPAEAWQWQWTFNGQGTLEGEKVRVNASWHMRQMPTVRIDKVSGK